VLSTLHRITVLIVTFVERFLLSFVFFCLAWAELNKINSILGGELGKGSPMFIGVAQHLILLLLGGFTSLLLLVGRRPEVPRQNFKLVFVPLATTFFYLFYQSVPSWPLWLRMNPLSQKIQVPLTVAGLAFAIIGPAVALWGILHLGRSFGIFVTVRKIVSSGPYRWVRHPMYLGWVCFCIGLALANFSPAYVFLASMHILLLVYRAHLEETELARSSEEYRDYKDRTGFIFPRLRHAPSLIAPELKPRDGH
jgi:protein-S-isoprenylcysteine O-methyltransferase Ste14